MEPIRVEVASVKVWLCLRCQSEWRGRGADTPKRCGKCKSPYWDVLRTMESAARHAARAKVVPVVSVVPHGA